MTIKESSLHLISSEDLLKEKGKLFSTADILLPPSTVLTFRTDLWVSQTMDLICQKQRHTYQSLLSWEARSTDSVSRGLPRFLALIKTPFELQFCKLEALIVWWADLQGRRKELPEILARVHSLTLSRYLDLPWSELSPRVRFLSFISAFLNPEPVTMIFIPGASFVPADWQTIEQSLLFLARSLNISLLAIREDSHATQFTEYFLNADKLKLQKEKSFSNKTGSEEEDENEVA